MTYLEIGAVITLSLTGLGTLAIQISRAAIDYKNQTRIRNDLATHQQEDKTFFEQFNKNVLFTAKKIKEVAGALNGGATDERAKGYVNGITYGEYDAIAFGSQSLAFVEGAILREIHDLREHVATMQEEFQQFKIAADLQRFREHPSDFPPDRPTEIK